MHGGRVDRDRCSALRRSEKRKQGRRSPRRASTIAATSNQRIRVIVRPRCGSTPRSCRRSRIARRRSARSGRDASDPWSATGVEGIEVRAHRRSRLPSGPHRSRGRPISGTGVSYHVGPTTSACWPPSLILLIASRAPTLIGPASANPSVGDAADDDDDLRVCPLRPIHLVGEGMSALTVGDETRVGQREVVPLTIRFVAP